jgi:drug/metabolite transporter (DMT)-like permease
MKRPRLSPALFALVCLSFLLPFASVSCDGASTSFTGAQLVTYTVPAGGALSESDCKGDISTCVEARASWLALIALALALGGLVFGLRGRQKGPGWFATGGVLTMLGLIGQGLMTFATVEFRAGLWAMLLLFFAAMCLHGGYALQRRREERDEDPQPEPQAIV